MSFALSFWSSRRGWLLSSIPKIEVFTTSEKVLDGASTPLSRGLRLTHTVSVCTWHRTAPKVRTNPYSTPCPAWNQMRFALKALLVNIARLENWLASILCHLTHAARRRMCRPWLRGGRRRGEGARQPDGGDDRSPHDLCRAPPLGLPRGRCRSRRHLRSHRGCRRSEAGGGPSAKRQAKVMDDLLEPGDVLRRLV